MLRGMQPTSGVQSGDVSQQPVDLDAGCTWQVLPS